MPGAEALPLGGGEVGQARAVDHATDSDAWRPTIAFTATTTLRRMSLRVPPSLRDAVDRVVIWLARIVARAWFRFIETEHLDRVSTDRPVIVATNHANGFIDPLVVIATSPRPLHFLAKGTLWKVPVAGLALDLAGVLPVHRREDTDGSVGNDRTFDACHRVLAQDGAIGIFPEGRLNDTTQLKPLRTGAARIALGARQAGALGLRIVPVGLVYGEKAKPRNRVLVRAGEPIDLDEVLTSLLPGGGDDGPDNHELVDALTDLLAQRLAAASLDYGDQEAMQHLAQAAMVYQRAPEADPGKGLTIAGVEPVARRIDRAPASQRQAVLQAIDRYLGELDVLGLEDTDVVPGNTPERLQARLSRSGGKVAVLAVPAVVGAAVNVVPYQAMRFVWKRPVARISKANNTVLSAMVAFPVAWLGWGLAGRARGLRHPWRWVMLGGPVCGQACVACWEQLSRFRRSKLHWKRTMKAGDLLADVREKRAAVVAAVADALAAGEGAATT